MKRIIYFLLMIILVTGCKTSKQSTSKTLVETKKTTQYIASKLQISIPNTSMTVNGTMKMKTNDRIQLNVLMPILRTEMYRIEFTPNEVIVIDRGNKQYIKTSFTELSSLVSTKISFETVQKLLLEASKPDGKKELTTSDLGLPYIKGAKVRLYDFTDKEFAIEPTTISDKYQQVTLNDFIDMLED